MSLERLQAYGHLLETVTLERIDDFDGFLAEDARFVDPFNDVRGRERIKRIFAAMFHDLSDLSVRVTHVALASDAEAGTAATGFVHWHMGGRLVRLRDRRFAVTGVSRVDLDQEGKVTAHIDYWDPATGLYEHFPLFGPALRWLRRRLAATG